MSIFGGNDTYFDESADELTLSDSFREACTYDELSHLPDDVLNEFLASDECQVMYEEGMVSRRTLVRLSKNDDLSRRTTMAALDMGRKDQAPEYKVAVKYRKLYKQAIAKLVKKYRGKAEKQAKESQKAFIKSDKKFFTKAGATEALKTSNTAMKVDSDKAKGKSKWLKNDKK